MGLWGSKTKSNNHSTSGALDASVKLPTDIVTLPAGTIETKLMIHKITAPIDKITYGIPSKNIDVTSKIVPFLVKNRAYQVTITNQLMGEDPIPGVLKQVVIILHDGKTITLPEKSQIVISLEY